MSCADDGLCGAGLVGEVDRGLRGGRGGCSWGLVRWLGVGRPLAEAGLGFRQYTIAARVSDDDQRRGVRAVGASESFDDFVAGHGADGFIAAEEGIAVWGALAVHERAVGASGDEVWIVCDALEVGQSFFADAFEFVFGEVGVGGDVGEYFQGARPVSG